MFAWFDPIYLLGVLLPGMALALGAQAMVRSAYRKAQSVSARSRVSGAEAAATILARAGLRHVSIEQTHGHLSDHYDPRQKVLRLSADVFHGRDLAALGIAAHEAGHALQDAKRYMPLMARNAIVPMASVGSNMSYFCLLAGFLLNAPALMLVGIGLFSLVVLFQLINLPCEFDASHRAKQQLLELGLVAGEDEQRHVRRVLNAAAMTYVAAVATAVLTLLYYLWRSGFLGGSQR